MLFLGLDLGTQGIRVVIADETGRVASEAALGLQLDSIERQDPAQWWLVSCQAIAQAIEGLKQPDKVTHIAGVSVDSTSGTVLPVDAVGDPIGQAFMYCDTSAQAEADLVNDAAGEFLAKLGYRFNAAFGLPKILWIRRHEPAVFDAAHKIIHPTDFLNGKLCGRFDRTDHTNALKSGYDLVDRCWPAFIQDALAIPQDKLPQVTDPGQPLGTVDRAAAARTGLPEGTPVVTGMSDGTASFVSSGALREGAFNATLGTTLVVKGTTTQRIACPSGALYCARHPRGEGFWLPGGGSFVGGAYLAKHFGENLAELEAQAGGMIPTGIALYPIVSEGERFPFINPAARAFAEPEPSNDIEHLAAAMEGVGYVERWIYEMIEGLGAPVGEDVYTSGGGCKSDLWLQIRADITGRQMRVPAVAEAAMGSAINAAAALHFGDIVHACDEMITYSRTHAPRPATARKYSALYNDFRSACTDRGYV